MPRFCASCGAQMCDAATACPACGKAAAQSVGGGAAAATAPAAGASGGMADNVAAAIGCIPLIGLILLFVEPYSKNKFVRFYAIQAVAQGVCWFVGNIVCMVIPILGWFILLPLWTLTNVIMMIVCAVKAYGNNKFKLPV